jgi:uncharacterized membrane protein
MPNPALSSETNKISRYSAQRLDAFSDGVFAIVITLLVLELRVPEMAGNKLLHRLAELLPKFVSFMVSFFYISIYWINHSQLFHQLKAVDRRLFWFNSLFLMFLTFIPFPTALIGSYPHDRVAIVFYGFAMLATAVSFIIMKLHINREGLNEKNDIKGKNVFYIVAGPLLYTAAILLAFIDIKISIAIYLLIPIIYICSGK